MYVLSFFLFLSHFSVTMSIASAQAPLLEISLLHGRHGSCHGHSHSHGHGPVHFMGGGPRTYPGGVSKWQWKRMQLKKAKQIEKARLMREKHVYEARRRAELLAASPVLEMPWQKMSRVRPPNYVSADEQVTKLAARFQKEGAEDLWTEKDGPERFESLEEEEEEEYDYSPKVEYGHRHRIDEQVAQFSLFSRVYSKKTCW